MILWDSLCNAWQDVGRRRQRLGRQDEGRRPSTPRRRDPFSAPLLVLGLLILLYVLNFGLLSTAMHDSFRTHAADLGNMDQPIWNTLHGRLLQETKKNGTEGTRLSDHFEPIFLPVSLVFLIWDDVRALLWLQTLALALGAIPIYWIARDAFQRAGLGETGGETWGLGFAAVYLLFPALGWANVTEFHAVPLAVAPLLFALHYTFEERYDRVWVFALLAMSTQEHIPLLTMMLGFYIAVVRRRPRVGAMLALVSAAWFSVATFVIIPHYAAQVYRGQGASVYFQRFGELGNTPADIFRSLLTRPWLVLGIAMQPDRLAYLGGLLASTGFVALLDPLVLILALPTLGINMLSGYYAQYSGQFHYSAPLVPFFVVASIFGALRLTRWLTQAISRPAARRLVPALVLGAVLVTSLGYHRRAGASVLAASFRWPNVTAHDRALGRFAEQIPPQAPLSATAQLFPHFTHRRRMHVFPTVADAQYVLIDVTGMNEMHPVDLRTKVLSLVEGGDFGVRDAADGYLLLQRGLAGRQTIPDAFYDFARASAPAPRYPADIVFGDAVRFLGFDADVDPWGRAYTRTYWQPLRPLPPNARPWPFLVDDERQVLEEPVLRPPVATVWYPPERWRVGETVVVQTIPWDVGGDFWVAAGFLAGERWADPAQRLPIRSVEPGNLAVRRFDGDTWARLAHFVRRNNRLRLTGEERLWDVPPYIRTLEARWGEVVALRGYEAACWQHGKRQHQGDVCTAGAQVNLILYWQALRPMDRNYTVFVHLVDAGGQIVAQVDRQPQAYTYPTRWWAAGEVVPDEMSLELPADAPPGPYRLRVGLYDAETGERLPLVAGAGGDGAADLGVVP
ncbi:MAG: DUF2079 domain-containing protein [Chloroflexi bacterium]|nr:DUF2079 domain-containing protein [Chloroflexota bacterium]